jgi:small subunit ribosomal protein S8
MVTDPIADYLTRVRNAIMAKHRVVDIPSSNMKVAISKILLEKGYILNYKVVEDNKQNVIKIALKYDSTNISSISKLIRISKPGLRKYSDTENMPRVLNGLGIAILSTSKGVISNKEAADLNVGGEVLCHVY